MLETGQIASGYKILERIGEGGMAEVFRAEDLSTGEEVALKALKDHLVTDPAVVRRFVNEAHSLKRVRSPGIVKIMDQVEEHEQQPPVVCLVMELLCGEDLDSRLAEVGQMVPLEAAGIAQQVASILEAVHDAELLHRDLKPANIFLLQVEGEPQIKLLDFGAAKALSDEPQLEKTDPGTAIGTPVYMAPEQITDQAVDQRTDVYALGAVLFRMLTGRVPFQAKSYGDLMLQLVTDLPPRVGDIRTAAPEAPPELEEVVARCLEKEPTDRFGSMGEVVRALQACIEPASELESVKSGEIEIEPTGRQRDTTSRISGVPSSSPQEVPAVKGPGVSRVVAISLGLVAAVSVAVAVTVLLSDRPNTNRSAAPIQARSAPVAPPVRIVPSEPATHGLPKPAKPAKPATDESKPPEPKLIHRHVKRRHRKRAAAAVRRRAAAKAATGGHKPPAVKRPEQAAVTPVPDKPKPEKPKPKAPETTEAKAKPRPATKKPWIVDPSFD